MADTIFAVASGQGAAAIAIVRISGPLAARAIEKMCRISLRPRAATVSNICDAGSGILIDRALVLWFPGPNSFTGEDSAEFQVHGGRAVIVAILRSLAGIEGFRPALAGEFTRRAFVNGKMDLTEAEGLADLIVAETDAQLRQALGVAAGGLRAKIECWREALIRAQAVVAAEIDFSDEGDVPSEVSGKEREAIFAVRDDIKSVLADGRRGEIVRDGFRVVIAGPPNAGKSSLLNAIARRDVAIVSDQPGTTRDLIEVHLDLVGFPVVFVDTAGLRNSKDKVEKEGMSRAVRSAQSANLVVWLNDPQRPEAPPGELEGAGKVLVVVNKIDLYPGMVTAGFAVSAVSGAGIAELLDEIVKRVELVVGEGEPAILTRERHRVELSDAAAALGDIREHWGRIELVAEDLRHACRRLAGVIGYVDVDDVLDEIFSKFCIGK